MRKQAQTEGKEEPKTFPKREGEDGPDRFVPPDRPDQIEPDEADKPQEIQVRDLGADIEVIEDRGSDKRDEDQEGLRTEDDDDEPSDRRARRRVRVRRQDDADDGDDAQYSRKVRARINRERALKEQERIRAENAERTVRQLQQRVERLERVADEVKENQSVKDLEQKIAETRKALEQAVEEGKTAEQLDLTIKLGDLQADLKLLKRDLEQQRRAAIARETEEEGDPKDQGATTIPPLVSDWKRANARWYGKAAFKDANADAIQIDKDIISEIKAGDLDIEMYSEEHMQLLNERLAELYPDLPIHNVDGEPFELAEDDEEPVNDRNTRGRNGRPQAPVRGAGSARSGRRQQTDVDLARQGRVRLDENDFRTMRLFGLDPDNAEHKKRFARERMRTILSAERGERR